MTDPAAFTDSRWAAQEARRIALEEAAAIVKAKADELCHGIPTRVIMARPFRDIEAAIRALIEAGK